MEEFGQNFMLDVPSWGFDTLNPFEDPLDDEDGGA
jgi:hypothetical protein